MHGSRIKINDKPQNIPLLKLDGQRIGLFDLLIQSMG